MRPNILFILIDDLGWRDVSCYGSSFYETPRLDQLAREGMMFHHAYAASPVCSPTRASILSGKYPARVGVTQWIGGHLDGRLKDVPYVHELPHGEQSLATTLGAGGYQTWHVGKWHLGEEPFYPQHHGFDVNIGGSHLGHPHHGYVSPYRLPMMEEGPDGEYLTDRMTDEAIQLIRNRQDRPFFLNLWHYAVHTPIQAPEALVRKYRDKATRLMLDRKNPFVVGEAFSSSGPPGPGCHIFPLSPLQQPGRNPLRGRRTGRLETDSFLRGCPTGTIPPRRGHQRGSRSCFRPTRPGPGPGPPAGRMDRRRGGEHPGAPPGVGAGPAMTMGRLSRPWKMRAISGSGR